MTVTFRTIVLDVPPSPLGLLAGRLVIEHWCNQCVATRSLPSTSRVMPALTTPTTTSEVTTTTD
jgi:hypothetical protein